MAQSKADKDCEAIKEAFKGWGSDKIALINILCKRTNEELQAIRDAYKGIYGKEFIEELKSETSGDLTNLLVGLCRRPAEFDAHQLRDAMKGMGTNEDVLVEILTSRLRKQLKALKEEYQTTFNRDLDTDLQKECSKDLSALLVSLSQADRKPCVGADPAKAEEQAQKLYEAGVKKFGTDESTFNAIFTHESWDQIRAIIKAYKKIGEKPQPLEKAIKSEFTGNMETALLAICQLAQNAHEYFADQLHYSMKGIGTNDDQLVRVIVSRGDIHMKKIAEHYESKYEKPLLKAVESETKGPYGEALKLILEQKMNE